MSLPDGEKISKACRVVFEIYAVVRFTPLRGRRTPGVPIGGSKYRNGLVTPDFYIVVHCNYGSIWLRFRDMTRDRQTHRRTDRHPHRFMIWPHVVGHIIKIDSRRLGHF